MCKSPCWKGFYASNPRRPPPSSGRFATRPLLPPPSAVTDMQRSIHACAALQCVRCTRSTQTSRPRRRRGSERATRQAQSICNLEIVSTRRLQLDFCNRRQAQVTAPRSPAHPPRLMHVSHTCASPTRTQPCLSDGATAFGFPGIELAHPTVSYFCNVN